jgi:hypothetical protein
MISKRFLNSLKLIIPLTTLLFILLSHFTALGQFLKTEDCIIFMICGLTLITGIETHTQNRPIGFFLISTSLILMTMRLILVFGL